MTCGRCCSRGVNEGHADFGRVAVPLMCCYCGVVQTVLLYRGSQLVCITRHEHVGENIGLLVLALTLLPVVLQRPAK